MLDEVKLIACILLLLLLVIIAFNLKYSSLMESRIGGREEQDELDCISRDLHRYRLSQRRLNIIRQTITNSGQFYEAKNALERWTLSVFNLSDSKNNDPWNTPGHILYELEPTSKFISELKAKRISLQVATDLVRRIIHAKVKFPEAIPLPLRLQSGQLAVGMHYISRYPGSRIDSLLERASMVNVACCAMRYDALLAGSQQWSIPARTYKKLYDKYNIDLEGFASPFNSQLLDLVPSDAKEFFCSIFPEDAVFGSAGSFFDVDLSGRRCVINPPFVESLIELVAQKIRKTLTAETKPCGVILCVVPSWKDAKFYHALTALSAECGGKIIELSASDNYFYEDTSDIPKKQIPAKFSSTWFCFGAPIDKADLL